MLTHQTFSIVTISYNQSRFLDEAILSIVNQDYPSIEYIVVDAGSSDGSRQIIEDRRHSIAKVIFEPDQGPADGLNKGFASASGEWLAFINADDALAPDSLSNVNGFLLDHPDVDIILGAGNIIDETNALIKPIRPKNFTLKKWLYGGAEFIQQGMFFRKSIYEKTGGFNIHNRTCWDAELLVDMLLADARLACFDEVLGLFRIHGESISGTGRLNAAYQLDQNRLFQKGIGRARNSIDHFADKYYRIRKWLSSPLYYAERRLHEYRYHQLIRAKYI